MITFLKMVLYSLIFILCTYLGILKSKVYINRLNALKDFKEALNIFKTKIRFTYATLPEIFKEIGESIEGDVGQVFIRTSTDLQEKSTCEAWNDAIEKCESINDEDKRVLFRISESYWEKQI